VTGKLAERKASEVGADHRTGGSQRGARALAWIGVLFACADALSCTEPAERAPVRVRIEAEAAVRALADDVEVVVEARTATGGWQARKMERFEPKTTHEWPLELRVESRNIRLSYQVTATARDDHKAIVGQVRAIRDADSGENRRIVLVFEASCVRRMQLCPNGHTCHLGECIDAHYEAEPDSSSGQAGEPAPATDAGMDPGGPPLGTEGEPCDAEGARACLAEASRTPLRCMDGTWHSEPICSEDQLCDTTPGARRGTCRSIAVECLGHDPNVNFCDRDVMRVCKNMFESAIRPCGDNMRCVATDIARCECETGFVNAAVGCERPADCSVANGGCDALTKCTMESTGPSCSACPPGYVGKGMTGCEPLLEGLVPSVGELSPAFDPRMNTYRVRVPLLAQQVTLTPTATADARIELNGAIVAKGRSWTTPTLPLGEFPVKLRLTSSGGETTDYDVIVERAGAQAAYLKASNAEAQDMFGFSLAMSGDTLVVAAAFEDSGASAVDGDQASNSLSSSGAAYVFVQRGGTWEQQAYLKANDAAAGDYFGTTVAIDEDTIVVGAIRDNILGLTLSPDRAGAAYVFTRSAGRWTQATKLAPSTAVPGDLLGYSVAVEGDTIAVGAPHDGQAGATYVFTRVGGPWKEQQKLRPSGGSAGATFGSAVALSQETLVVGATDDSTEVDRAGSAYIFVRSGTTWSQQQRLVPSPASSGASVGFAVALQGDEVLLGAPRVASIVSFAQTDPGEVFAFRRTGQSWKQTARLRAMLPRTSDSFGSSLAVSDRALLIGACGDGSGARGVGADPSRRDRSYSGAAYLYAKENEDWKLSAYLKAANADTNDMFGASAALSGETVVVGAIFEASSATGVNGNQENNGSSTAGAVYFLK
jgi:hypothetical protein